MTRPSPRRHALPNPPATADGLAGRLALILGSAGALVLAAAIAGAVALTHGGGASKVIVPNNSVARIDATHARIASYVGVGRRPIALAVDANGVWVVNADDGTVNELDLATGRLAHTIGIGADVNDVAIGFGSVWIADGNDGTVTRIDSAAGRIERTLQLTAPDALGPNTVFFVATDNRYVWVTLGDQLLRIDPATNRVTGRLAVGAPTTLATGGGSVWVTTVSERLLRIDSRSVKLTASPELSRTRSEPPSETAALARRRLPEPRPVDPLTLAVDPVTSGLQSITTVAAGAGSVWVGNEDGGLQRIDASTGNVLATLRSEAACPQSPSTATRRGSPSPAPLEVRRHLDPARLDLAGQSAELVPQGRRHLRTEGAERDALVPQVEHHVAAGAERALC